MLNTVMFQMWDFLQTFGQEKNERRQWPQTGEWKADRKYELTDSPSQLANYSPRIIESESFE